MASSSGRGISNRLSSAGAAGAGGVGAAGDVTLAGLCESYLPPGHPLDAGTVAVVAALARSHNLLARNVPPAWSACILARLQHNSASSASALSAVALGRDRTSLVAALQLLRLTLAEACAAHVGACARRYWHALAAAWQAHDDAVVRALVANCMEGLLRRCGGSGGGGGGGGGGDGGGGGGGDGVAGGSDVGNLLRAEVLPKLQLVFATKSRAVQLRYHQKPGPSLKQQGGDGKGSKANVRVCGVKFYGAGVRACWRARAPACAGVRASRRASRR